MLCRRRQAVNPGTRGSSNDWGRWQISLYARLKRELLSLLYLTVGLNEIFDSRPPGDANKNDFSLTTSLGWTF